MPPCVSRTQSRSAVWVILPNRSLRHFGRDGPIKILDRTMDGFETLGHANKKIGSRKSTAEVLERAVE